MRKPLHIVLLLVQAAPLVVGWQDATASRSLRDRLSSPVDSYTLDTDTALAALMEVAGDFHLPMGIEWIKTPAGGPRFNRSWQHTSIETMLQDIAKSLPGYEVEDPGGTGAVVHVRPSALRGDGGDIVNTDIGLFEVKNEFVAFASRRLQDVARAFMTVPGPAENGAGEAGSIGSGVGDRKVTLTVEKGTVRDILDRLCLAADLKIWIVTYPPVRTTTARGFLRTASLYSDLPIEDRWQPAWTFLPWAGSKQK